MGHMSRRKIPVIIRSHQWSLQKEPQQFFHAQLLLYFPWRNESQDLCGDSYEETSDRRSDVIKQNRSSFEHHAEAVERAIANLEESGMPEDSWQLIAPQTAQMQSDDAQEGFQPEGNHMNAFQPQDDSGASRDINITQFEYELASHQMTTSEWRDLILSLNDLQYELHQFIVDWCISMALSQRGTRTDPFHIFLTGGGLVLARVMLWRP